MCHKLWQDAKLYAFLLRVDEDRAAEDRAAGCECGGALHTADYPRKPRGGAVELGREHDRRISFCCDRDGCRRRMTPPSVRFLGRRVFLGAVVVLVSAMLNGPTPKRVAILSKLVGVSERTLRRWQVWWRAAFAKGAFWKSVAGQFAAPVPTLHLPASLLERLTADERERLVAALRLLSPITTTSGRSAMAS